MPSGQGGRLRQPPVRVGEHPRRGLDARLDDQSGDLVPLALEEVGERPERRRLVEVGAGHGANREEDGVEPGVEGLAAAHARRPRGVAVVRVAEGHEAGALGVAGVALGQQRDAQRRLDRGRTRLAVEDAGEPGWRDPGELLGEQGARRVGLAQEGAVRDPPQLLACGAVQGGVRVAVDRAPEAADPVEVTATRLVAEPAAVPGADDERCLLPPVAGLREGVPEMAPVGGDHCLGRVGGGHGESREVERPGGLRQRVDAGGVAEVGQHSEHGYPALVGDLGGVLGDEGRLVPGGVHQHDPDHAQPGAERCLDGERGVVDGPEPGERRDHHAGVEAPEQVAHRPPGRERHEQAAHPLDQEQVAAGGPRLDRSGQSLDVQLPALRGRRGEGRAGQ